MALLTYEAHWNALTQQARQRRLHHALLLAGPKEAQKLAFAQAFAQSLLRDSYPLDAHPNCLIVAPEEKSSAIKVDQIRHLIHFMRQTGAGYRVVIIHPAQAMNQAAQNALLKILEEPGQDALFILVADSLASLLPTVVSRCQMHKFALPPESSLILEQAHERKALAEQLFKLVARKTRMADVMEIALKWPAPALLQFMMSLTTDLLKLSLTGVESTVKNKDIEPVLKDFVNLGMPATFWDQCYETIFNRYKMLQDGANLNLELLLEHVFFLWERCDGSNSRPKRYSFSDH